MKIYQVVLAFIIVILGSCSSKGPNLNLQSPDNSIKVSIFSSEGKLSFTIKKDDSLVLDDSQLGVKLKGLEFSNKLELTGVSEISEVNDAYELAHGKKSKITYHANEKTFHLANESGNKMDVIFRISNDGVAFRYHFPEAPESEYIVEEEATTYNFPGNTKCWLQPMSVSKTGWSNTNPSYEEHYVENIPVGQPSPLGAGWVYPGLFKTGDNWLLITEAGLDRNYCGSRLVTVEGTTQIKVGFPDDTEVFTGKGNLPVSSTSFSTPWRVIALGSLATIMESTLGTDLANPAIDIETDFIKPGYASWSWLLLKDNSVNYDVQKKFIDYAAELNWQYCLVDVNWDNNIGYEKIRALSEYAQSKGVGLILWYNSSGDWNETEYTPKSKLLTHEDRVAEFSKLKEMGIKGIKVDFFGGDGQSVIEYYLDIFKDAADYQLMVNCHGATLPRGWQRTYPNLVTIEAIMGYEFITFDQRNADKAPAHMAMAPFTRNVFDPMDFTPMVLDTIPNIQRRTTNGFDLATSILFLSGVQHMGEKPEGMATVPEYVKAFLQNLPTQWDDVKFIEGFPGKEVILARKAGDSWYIVGINGEDEAKEFNLDLSQFGASGTIITDGETHHSFSTSEIELSESTTITIKPAGGFVIKTK